ncbi:MAG TPA: glycosyltransferase [Polyangiaceae bacterium]|nr:glycosyltransferase [Polyangiaceae bacterium]
MTPERIPPGAKAVVCITDRNYLLPTKVMLSSLVRVLAPDVQIFVMSRDVRIEDFSDVAFRDRVTGVVDYSSSEHFAELSKSGFRGRTHVSSDATTKLLLPFMFRNHQRVLYLDVDMICCSADINRLFELDLNGALVAAVPDAKIAFAPFRDALNLQPEKPYFNSGLVLFDIPACLAWLSERLVMDRTASIVDKVRFVDQDTLNYIYRNRVHYLELRFNIFANVHMGGGNTLPLEQVQQVAGEAFMSYPSTELLRALEERVVLHYTSSSKPWKMACGHDELWWQECEAIGLGSKPAWSPKEEGPGWSAPLEPAKKAVRWSMRMARRVGRAGAFSARALGSLAMQPFLAEAPREALGVPTVVDLRWARRPDELRVELERLGRDYEFSAGATVLVADGFRDSLEQLRQAWGRSFALDETRLADGVHFRTELLVATAEQLAADSARVAAGQSPEEATLGEWIELRGGAVVATRARFVRPDLSVILKLPSAHYDEVLAAAYRAAEQGAGSPPC